MSAERSVPSTTTHERHIRQDTDFYSELPREPKISQFFS